MIKEFRGPYRFLSNFFPCTMEYKGEVYRSSEHAFQSAKFDDPELKKIIRTQEKPSEAKRIARVMDKEKRKDWGSIRVDVMREVLKIKFAKQGFRDQLLATGDQELQECNTWGDKFWGICDGEGSNWLGKLLMEIREDIRNESGTKPNKDNK